MSITDRLTNRFARPAAHAVDVPVREVVQQVLKEHGFATPAEVAALRDEVKDARRRADAVEARLKELIARVEAPAAPRVDPQVEALTAKIAELERQLAGLASRPTVQVNPPAAPLLSEPRANCKVDDCDGEVRSKGFCSPHYQQWRRGTLAGFVGPEGTIVADKRILHVPARLAGGKVEIDGKKVLVDGKDAPTVKGW